MLCWRILLPKSSSLSFGHAGDGETADGSWSPTGCSEGPNWNSTAKCLCQLDGSIIKKKNISIYACYMQSFHTSTDPAYKLPCLQWSMAQAMQLLSLEDDRNQVAVQVSRMQKSGTSHACLLQSIFCNAVLNIKKKQHVCFGNEKCCAWVLIPNLQIIPMCFYDCMVRPRPVHSKPWPLRRPFQLRNPRLNRHCQPVLLAQPLPRQIKKEKLMPKLVHLCLHHLPLRRSQVLRQWTLPFDV